MAKKIRYYKIAPEPIDIYKKHGLVQKKQLSEKTLDELRRLQEYDHSNVYIRVKKKILDLNFKLKKKQPSDIANIIQIWLK